MPRIQSTFLFASLALSIPAVAAADEPAAGAPVRFSSLGADALRSEAGVELTLGHYDGASDQPIMARLSGQYVLPSGYGGYAVVSGATMGDANAISNLELGGVARFDRGPELSIGARVGLVLPTATDDIEFLSLYLPQIARRSSDLTQAFPDLTALRASVAPTYRSGQLTVRGDVGVDIIVDDGDSNDTDALAHLDLGAGYQFGQAAATVELSSVISLGDDDDGSLHNFSLGGQYDLGAVTAHAAFTLPLETVDGDLFDGAYALSLGVTAPL